MRKTIKRTVAILLVLVTVLSMVSTAFAAGENTAGSNNDVQVSGNGTLGTMLAENIADELDTGANNISDLIMDGSTATVTFQTVTSAEIVVAIYDEADTTMLASGKIEVNEESTEAEVIIEGTIPDYFIARAFMLDIESHEALCKEYTTQLYTHQVQELLKMSTDDFNDELVINLDEDKTTNFGVFKEDTIQIENTDTANQITDNGNGTYTIKNANETFKKLKSGNTFAYTYPDGSLLLVKVKSVKVSGNTVTVTEDEDVDLTDFFDYMKIEEYNDGSDIIVDDSVADEGVTRVENTPSSNKPKAKEGEGSASKTLSYSLSRTFVDGKNGSVKLTGSLKLSITATVKFYLSFKYQHISVEIKPSASISANLSGELSAKLIKFTDITIPINALISLKATQSLVIEASAEISASAEIYATVGVAYDRDTGFKNLCQKPTVDTKIEVEGTIFAGLKEEVALVLVNEKLCKAAVDGTFGAELKSTFWSTAHSDSEQHSCKKCLDGEVFGVFKSSAKLNLGTDFLFFDGYEKSVSLCDYKVKLFDVYWSFDYGDKGIGTCPHISYRVILTVVDESGSAVSGATVVGTNLPDIITTNSDGKATFYLSQGEYMLTVTKDNMIGTEEFHIIGEPKEITVTLKQAKIIDSGSCGDNATWTLTDDGVLTIGGTGSMWDYGWTYAPWHDNRSSIKCIIISDSVTTIGIFAFRDCTSLTSVTIPGSVTTIDEYAFWGCDSLTSVTIPNSVTMISPGAFSECLALKSIKIPDSVTTIGMGTFENCTSLTSVTIGNCVKVIGYDAFNCCYSLTSVTIPDSVTTICDDAFYNCASLKDVYYCGSQSDWQKIDIGDNNDSLLNATIHYNYTIPNNTSSANTPHSLHTGTVTAKSGTTTASYTNLNPNSQYIFIVVKDPNATDLLAPSNLLYIAQQEADNSGNVTFTYKTRTGERGTELMYGAERTSQAGDIDANGSIDNADLVTLARHIVGLRDFTTAETIAADMNGDKTIDNSDLVSLARMIVGL